jgi:hypothetical protein
MNKDRARINVLVSVLPKHAICAEIGVWKGIFAEQLIKELAPRKLYLIDPYEFMPTYSHRIYGGVVAKNQQDMDAIFEDVSIKFSDEKVQIIRTTSDTAVKAFKDNYFDWVYIDGNHSYEFVKADLNNYTAKVKVNGFITGDDYNLPEVKKAVNEFVEENEERIELMLIKQSQFIMKKL